ncbi:SDR family oxidoreductase [Sphingomonas sp. BIUV-7]|uniref:SDR family oxidoreductase n=1 Tax=Sphingomonas natans TaxID=3063330 RepID=A0ABT8Y955_9SPHN|nr:SDR family oxidoreductase [Sphingomonas sp. BIUV-7]MDO6414507.1 SDR family oxidoreductase [Sphingomonas sp. BIUV-7]
MTRTLLLTGAAGGMGRACARLFGATHDLVLTDVAAAPLESFAQDLTNEGYSVRQARAGDLGDASLLAPLVADLGTDGPVTLVHTAGLSPAMGDWKTILTVNLVATVKLLDAVEPVLTPGSVAVVIASTAGHMLPQSPDWLQILDSPLDPDLTEKLTPIVEGMAQGATEYLPGIGYSLSKQAVLRLVEQRARSWGQRRARIVSISPGLILTPMGRKELAETQGAAQMMDAAPVGRGGRAIDIALAAQFLASEQAAFISGTDLRVDGGSVAGLRFAGATNPS